MIQFADAAAWDVLVRSPDATTEAAEDFQERVKQPAFHRPGLSVHKNLALAVISGESFTGILDDPANSLFRTLYVLSAVLVKCDANHVIPLTFNDFSRNSLKVRSLG